MILCNNITTADESFLEDNTEIFYTPCETCKDKDTSEGCEECNGDGQHDTEPYQYFLASLTDWDKDRLTEYGVTFGYSNALDVDVIPIYDFGTSWSAFSYSKEVEDDYALAHDETLSLTTPY